MSAADESPAGRGALVSGRYETLLVEERDDRVVVTLHRPEARNAISGLMIRELHAVCDLLERDPKFLL
ncbi:enoyl-CoA hydratase/isomerase family protein, partial [Streptomyces sp. NPDC057927]